MTLLQNPRLSIKDILTNTKKLYYTNPNTYYNPLIKWSKELDEAMEYEILEEVESTNYRIMDGKQPMTKKAREEAMTLYQIPSLESMSYKIDHTQLICLRYLLELEYSHVSGSYISQLDYDRYNDRYTTTKALFKSLKSRGKGVLNYKYDDTEIKKLVKDSTFPYVYVQFGQDSGDITSETILEYINRFINAHINNGVDNNDESGIPNKKMSVYKLFDKVYVQIPNLLFIFSLNTTYLYPWEYNTIGNGGIIKSRYYPNELPNPTPIVEYKSVEKLHEDLEAYSKDYMESDLPEDIYTKQDFDHKWLGMFSNIKFLKKYIKWVSNKVVVKYLEKIPITQSTSK